MRKIGVFIAIAALSTALFTPSPSQAFGLNLGPFHLRLPLPGPVLGRRHLAAPAREAASSQGLRDEANLNAVEPSPSSALLYPVVTAPPILDDVFWPSSAQWPFNYDAIFQSAFAKAQPDQDAQLCTQPNRIDSIVGRIQSEIRPTRAQVQQLQRLGGALHMAAAYLAKTCPNDIPAEPVARLQLMEWQIEKVAEALDIVRQPLQDFEQSLSKNQRERIESAPAAGDRSKGSENIAASCAAAPTATDWPVDQITSAVQPTDAQRKAVEDLKQTFGSAASQLDASCATTLPASPLARLEATEGRLDATWRAVVSIQVALADFESGLSDQQRVRLDATDFAASQ
jgi:LTXXQ motif family protein